MADKPLVYINEALAAYGFGNAHPFGTDRLGVFWSEEKQRGLDRCVQLMSPRQASEDDLLYFHTLAYLERVKRLSEDGTGWLDGGDTPAFPGMYETAATVAGCVLDAAERIMAACAFVPIAGLHHAHRDGAAGFCVFNDCGILIEHLKQVYGLGRIAYVDIDAPSWRWCLLCL